MQQPLTPDEAARPPPGGGPCWLADLDSYVASHDPGSPGGRRQSLVAAVKAAPGSADAWRAWLGYEEAHAGGATSHGLAGGDSGRVGLYHMYLWATQLVPRSKSTAYLQLWLGYARQQWGRSPDDARDTLKTLKNQHIGDGDAHLYHDWASLEAGAGNISKALGILAKGLRAEAQPASLLEQLKSEMQSGTFDLKASGMLTDTLTLDASSVAARALQQAHSTPAPAAPATSLKAPAPANRPGSAAHVGIASCLKSSSSAVAAPGGQQGLALGPVHEHAGRAVTFAADVQPGEENRHLHSRPAPIASGTGSACSSRSCVRSSAGGDGHSGCLSPGSTSSRSTLSVHDGTLPFSSGAVSYKSSTTESSGMDGSEEDTISCKATAGGAASSSKGSAGPKPSTAPLSSSVQHNSALASGGQHSSNTATLGLKRFGFKSRALRVGGAAGSSSAAAQDEAPRVAASAAGAGQPAPGAMPAPLRAPSTAGAGGSAVGRCDEDAAAGGRKRRAGEGSTPSPKTSPKLSLTSQAHQLSKAGSSSTVQPSASSAAVAPAAAAAAAGRTGGGSTAAAEAQPDGRGDDDSEPLVSSKLAARVAQDRGTPLAAAIKSSEKAAAAGWQPGGWTPPAEGHLPSSLESTPDGLLLTCTPPRSGAAVAAAAADGSSVPQLRGGASGSMQRAAVAAGAAAAGPAADSNSEQEPIATIVLPDVVTAPPASAAASRSAPMQHAACVDSGRAAAQPAPAAAAQTAATAPRDRLRDPLRPLQVQPSAPGQACTAGAAKAAVQAAPQQQPQQRPALQHQPAAPQQQQYVQQQQQQPPHKVLQQAPPPQQMPAQQQQQQQAEPQEQQQQVVRQSRPREDAQTVYVQGVRYTKLECVGRGGSSKVFKVMGPGCKIYALKRIRLAGRDAEAASGFIDEIHLLQRLRNKPNIIQLIDSQVFHAEGLIYMVQEYGEIDLARLLAKHAAARQAGQGSTPGGLQQQLDENFIRLYWQQMLQAVSGVHEQRIVHSDLKPANFLLVEGQLKLIDFGIAKAISGDTTSIARESQVGTLNYMSPEAILGGSSNILGGPAMRVGRPSDVWSLGCILYQMVYGRTPFAELPFLPKMHAICNPHHVVAYPALANSDLLDVMKSCLDRDPKSRISLQELLEHPFLHPHLRQAAAPTPAPLGLSEEQMKQLVAQVAAAGAAGMTDIDKLTRELMQKLGAAVEPAADAGTAAAGSRSRIPAAPNAGGAGPRWH